MESKLQIDTLHKARQIYRQTKKYKSQTRQTDKQHRVAEKFMLSTVYCLLRFVIESFFRLIIQVA
jgi:hypothetical protein